MNPFVFVLEEAGRMCPFPSAFMTGATEHDNEKDLFRLLESEEPKQEPLSTDGRAPKSGSHSRTGGEGGVFSTSAYPDTGWFMTSSW